MSPSGLPTAFRSNLTVLANRRGWLPTITPCRTSHRGTILFRLTAICCLAFLGYILLFNHVSSFGATGDSQTERRRGAAAGESGRQQHMHTAHLQLHALNTTQRSQDGRRPLGQMSTNNSAGQPRVQFVAGTPGHKGPDSRDLKGLAEDFRACVPRPLAPGNRSVFSAGLFTTAPKMTVKSCVDTCNKQLFPVAALRAGTECHCGRFTRDFRMAVTLSPRECNVPCAGDENHYCGGESTLSVYQTAAEDNRCSNISFRPVGALPLVALASFPGSGNTWVRYLIERATGIYTGSFYNDGDLFQKGFIGEKKDWTEGSTVAIKTHVYDEDHVRRFQSVILIVRNPYKAMLAEYNRLSGGHVGFAPETQFKNGTGWVGFVRGYSRMWAITVVNFLKYSKRLHVVYYEDLLSRLYDVLKGIVAFLNVPVDEERLLCVLSSPKGKFKRSGTKNPLTFDPYTKKMRDEMVNPSLKTVSTALKLGNCSELPKEYNTGLDPTIVKN